MNDRLRSRIYPSIVAILGLVLAIDLGAHLVADSLWFQELGYWQAFVARVTTQFSVWAIAFCSTLAFLGSNFWLARQQRYAPGEWTREKREALETQKISVTSKFADTDERLPLTRPLGLFWILLLGVGLGCFIGSILLHYGTVMASLWHPDWSLPSLSASMPDRLNAETLINWAIALPQHPWHIAVLVAVPSTFLYSTRVGASAISLILSLGFGMILSAHWAKFLQFLNATSFDKVDPVFRKDLSFYIFSLPISQLFEFWLFGLTFCALATVTLIYLFSGNALSEGQFPGFSKQQQRHLQALGGVVMLAIALRYWLRRYELLYSTSGIIYGASYTDVNVRLPVYSFLSVAALVTAFLLLRETIFPPSPRQTRLPLTQNKPRRPISLVYPIGGYFIAAIVLGWGLPGLVQRIAVQPNELAVEQPYLERSIEWTRASFNLDNIEVKPFDSTGELTPEVLSANAPTIENIRLWDTRPLLDTNRQLQQIRLYYRFNSAHLDRYTLLRDPTPENPRNIGLQQVGISARELDFSAFAEQARTWVNQHLIYTHGFGFTMSPVNVTASDGLPQYFVKGIGTGPAGDENIDSPIEAADANIRSSIPLGFPRIYYGELTDSFVLTSTNTLEFDYPEGNENVYNTYDGRGGIGIKNPFRRWLFAEYLRDWRLLWTPVKSTTKLLFRRNITDRVRYLAPFLRYDSQPYLVVADANLENPDERSASPHYLYWIIDAYTTSDRYPYSDPGDNSFNYMRNSVKVVVDAYNGTVKFYVADASDPIVRTYQKIFPNLFQPLDDLPITLRSHVRYPIDIFKVQSERLLVYHMTDYLVFYNREDLWQIPTEIYRNEPQQVKPYYLIMKLPTAGSEEFVVLHPFTPPNRSNLIAWLAGRSDGDNYGKLLLYQFTKQELVYGPEQIEARINQQPLISEQFSLWDQQGSRVVKGNLLVIPIERSLLYVEPIYLEAEQNSLPALVRVIVAYKDEIAMAPTLKEALDAALNPQARIPETIRTTDEIVPNVTNLQGVVEEGENNE
ncbi:MAG: UPF0182 family protein [Cyanobacteriota bacterium]|nr:UPF0182 family protein [Cyanobacteriota bacterium]